jgi:hypothetical protein
MRSTIVALTLALPGLATAEPKVCAVSGKSVTLHEVTVSPRGEDAFAIDLFRTPATALLPARCGDALTLQLTGSIEATAKRKGVWIKLARDVKSPDGMILGKRGARVIDACVSGAQVRAKAIIGSDDVLEGERKQPDSFVSGFEVPCDALTLDEVTFPDLNAEVGSDGTDRYWRLRGEAASVRVFADAMLGATSHVVEGPGHLREIKSKRGWVFAEIVGEGFAIRGWVPTAKLQRMPDDEAMIYGAMCTGDHDHNDYNEIPAPNSVERTGIVRADTRVYANQGRGEWGRFTAATQIKVSIIKGESWARLLVVPGLSGAPWLAGYVPLDTIKLDP